MPARNPSTDWRTPSWRLFLPGVGGWFLLYLMAAFLFIRPQMLLWDGGTCRLVLNGLWVLTRLEIPTANYVSLFHSQVETVSRSLVGDIVFGAAYQAFGLNGVVALASLALALALTWSYQLARARGMGPVSGLLVLVSVMAATSMHWSARGHVFGYLMLLAVFYVTFMSPARFRDRMWITALLMALWSNLHGSFMIGLLVLVVKALADFVDRGWSGAVAGSLPGEGGEERIKSSGWEPWHSPIIVVVAAAAACLNVRGAEVYGHIFSYLSHPVVMHTTDEWRSLDFSLGFPTWAFLSLFLILASLWAVSPAKPPSADFLLAAVTFVAGLYAMRLAPYFALLSLPLMGPLWSGFRSGLKTLPQGGRLRRAATKVVAVEEKVEAQEKLLLGAALARVIIVAAMCAVFFAVPGLKVKDFDADRLPVDAVTYLQSHDIAGPGFVLDNWGGYLYWRTREPVFIDDWADFYPVEFVRAYIATTRGEPVWSSVLDRYGVKYVMMPPGSILGQELSSSADWVRVYADPVAEIFLKNDAVGR